MWIKETVEKLRKQYDTNDPFQLVSDMGIVLLLEDLGSTLGYYSHCYEHQFIHINNRLSKQQQIITCAHELGHSVLHPNMSTPHLRLSTLFSVDKFELQANRFMVQLLVSDNDLKSLFSDGLGSYQIADIYGVPEYLIDYKVQTIDQ
ncbi:Metallopeptidase ImmA [bioreactor metagenome]|uniref:Metallopeptidase ImmA n=1 Tax=bioreactor metagenome TaxID=1076179 RepID=A0A645G7G4_9ZZZZ